MSFCTNCGQSLKPEVEFCGSCGIKKESTAKILEEERKKAETKLEQKGFFKRKIPRRTGKDTVLRPDWFWDQVEFRRQSNLAIGLGIFQMICSIFMLLWFPGDFFTKLLMFIVMICIGAVLISLGARHVPNYPSLKYAIQDYVDSKTKHS